ncbi:hypothetical protein V2J09_017370 [Rumex salicifolius]
MSCADFKAQFPSSNLEDNVCSKEGGFVSTGVSSQQKVGPFIVYTRRPKDKSSPTASMPSGSGGCIKWLSIKYERWEGVSSHLGDQTCGLVLAHWNGSFEKSV